jgi:Rap1a immunity proteins
MKWIVALMASLLSLNVLAYTADELRADCLAAEDFYLQQKGGDPYQSIRGARCMAYVAGFADGYAVSDYLADRVGVRLNAFCLPPDRDLPYRMLRAVLAHLDRQPPKSDISTATLVAGALAKTFPCGESLEPRK